MEKRLLLIVIFSFLVIGCATQVPEVEEITQVAGPEVIEEIQQEKLETEEIIEEEIKGNPETSSGEIPEEKNRRVEIQEPEIDYFVTFIDEYLEDDNLEYIVFYNKEWQKRINAALEPAPCTPIQKEEYPSSYYKGPLIDTHLHIPQLPDDDFGDEPEEDEEPRGVDADLYDEIPEEDVPLLGRSVKIDDIACALQQEGSIKAFAFFPVYPEIPVPLVEVAYRTMEKYPSLFVPFIQASGSEISTVEGKVLQKMLTIRSGLFKGFGEVGDSPTEPINLPPDAPIYLGDFQVAREYNLLVYFHPGEGHHKNLEKALQKFPDVTFIVHADFIEPYIDDLMDKYPNVYYTFDNIFEKHVPLFRFGDKEEFMAAMKRDWDRLLKDAERRFKPLIEAHPDRYMWGTDRADIAWNYDADVGQLLAKYGRAFIGRLNPAIQEKVAYKNAERILEED